MTAPVPSIVGLTGYAQHGKNTVGEVFATLGYRQMAFADALREMARRLNPIVRTNDGIAEYEVRYVDLLDEVGYEEAKKDPEVRRLLQVLGTECVRDILGDNAWVQALTRQFMPGEKYVVTDVRFPNEARAITDLGGEVWRVTRPDFDNGISTDHPSEAHIADLRAHVTLWNTGTIEQLQNYVKGVVGVRGLA